jgi:hypothetical protein
MLTKATAGSRTAHGKITSSGIPKFLNHFTVFTVHMLFTDVAAEHKVADRGFDTHVSDVIDCVQY